MAETVYDYRANPGALGASLGTFYFNMSGQPCYVLNDGVEHVIGGGIPVYNETPTGVITGTDGTDGLAAFTLAHTPNPAGSVLLLKTDIGTAVVMIAGVHFNLVGDTITYTAGNIPIVGQTHRINYVYV